VVSPGSRTTIAALYSKNFISQEHFRKVLEEKRLPHPLGAGKKKPAGDAKARSDLGEGSIPKTKSFGFTRLHRVKQWENFLGLGFLERFGLSPVFSTPPRVATQNSTRLTRGPTPTNRRGGAVHL